MAEINLGEPNRCYEFGGMLQNKFKLSFLQQICFEGSKITIENGRRVVRMVRFVPILFPVGSSSDGS